MQISPAVIEALSIAELPDVQWLHGDDLCDCTFQRIGMWKNPYLAVQQEIRLCCVWAELAKMFPQFFRVIPGYWDDNAGQWDTRPHEWNGESEMPKAMWHRQLARLTGAPLSEIRENFSALDGFRPKGRVRSKLYLPLGGEWVERTV